MSTLPLRSDLVPETLPGRHASASRVVLALVSRLLLFAAYQGFIAATFALRGHPTPWTASVGWWPMTATLTNLSSLALLRALLHREGRRWRDLVQIDRSRAAGDAFLTVGLVLVGAVVAMVPNVGLASLLWGDPEAPVAMFVQPLPLWAALVTAVSFPLTIALSELPTYFGYARPRLEALGARSWQAVALAALFLGLQHATLPLIFDGRFLLWRALMFLPFALFVGGALRWRPRLLPYFMVAHGLLDFMVAAMVLQVSLG